MAEPNVRLRDPRTATQAKFSISYCVASAIVLGRVGLAQFKPEALDNDAVKALAARISVAADPALADAGKETFSSPAIVEIDLLNGFRVRTFLREMRGHPNRPLSISQMRQKLGECAQGVLSREQSRALCDEIGRIEAMPDIRGLLQLVAGPARGSRADIE